MIPWKDIQLCPIRLVENIALSLAAQVDEGSAEAAATLEKVLQILARRSNAWTGAPAPRLVR